MPIREYSCADCKKNSESIERTVEDVLIRCPECGSENIAKVITAYGGYLGDLGSASVRPKNAGSFKK